MKQKLVAVISVLSLVIGMVVVPVKEIKAAETEPIVIEGSELLDVEESVGEMSAETRGTYLQKGVSSIGEIGTGKIKVGGTTMAQRVVANIGLSVIVERQVNGDWVRYTGWTVSDTNAFSLTSSKTLIVPRGYYYRVRCIHSANTDSGHSNTGGIYVD